MKILSPRDQVNVLEPDGLKETILDKSKSAIKSYSNGLYIKSVNRLVRFSFPKGGV